MPLGTLPYRGRVTAVNSLPSGDSQLVISIFDGNNNLLSTGTIVCAANQTDVRPVVQSIDDLIFTQMLNDGGGFPAAVLGLSDQFGE